MCFAPKRTNEIWADVFYFPFFFQLQTKNHLRFRLLNSCCKTCNSGDFSVSNEKIYFGKISLIFLSSLLQNLGNLYQIININGGRAFLVWIIKVELKNEFLTRSNRNGEGRTIKIVLRYFGARGRAGKAGMLPKSAQVQGEGRKQLRFAQSLP